MATTMRLTKLIHQLKYDFLYHKTDMIATLFRAQYLGQSNGVIYAIMYWKWNRGTQQPPRPKFVCTGSTFKSQDGEYRARIISYKQFIQIFARYEHECNTAEQLVVDRLHDHTLELRYSSYLPVDYPGGMARELSRQIESLRISMRTLALCWLVDFPRISRGTIENHMNKTYQTVIERVSGADLSAATRDMLESHEVAVIAICAQKICNVWTADAPDPTKLLQCGQKIFPLSVLETLKIGDINFGIWRELYASVGLSNLVLNGICPSFPFVNGWFYVQSANPTLFDNDAMASRWAQSDLATHMSKTLKRVDAQNYDPNILDMPINDKFMRLSQVIRSSLIFADSNLRLTDIAVCITSEWVGRTLRDLPELAACSHDLPEFQRYYDLLANIDQFAYVLFGFLYALQCANSRLGIIHGDLHMNNATIYSLSMPAKQRVSFSYDSAKQDGWEFEAHGIYPMVIDFSRAIIGSQRQISHEFGDNFAEDFFAAQRDRVVLMMSHFFPKYTERRIAQLKALLLRDFALAFKILSAMDSYVMSSNFIAMMTIDSHFARGAVKFPLACSGLITDIASRAEKLLMDNFAAAFDGNITTGDIEWPNKVLMQELFGRWKVSTISAETTEHFCMTAEMPYDIDDHDSWGPLLSNKSSSAAEYSKYVKLDESAAIDKIIERWE